MKFINLLGNIISENKQTKFSFLYDKYVGEPDPKGKIDSKKLSFDVFKEIVKSDPLTKYPENLDFETLTPEEMNSKVKVGGYTEWIIQNYLQPQSEGIEYDYNSPENSLRLKEYQRLFLEDLYGLGQQLKNFEQYKRNFPVEQRDIKKYTPRTLASKIFDYLENLSPEEIEKKEKKEKKRIIKKEREGYAHPGGKIIFNGSRYTVVKIEDNPLGSEAASWYGGYHDIENGESGWCTSTPESKYYKTYIKDGPLYVILANDDKGKVGGRTGLPQERYQFHFPDDQFMNRRNHTINKSEDGYDGVVDFLKNADEGLAEVFKKEFVNGLIKKTTSEQLIANYPNDASGKFVALYGFEELINSIPKTLSFIQIVNKSKEKIALDIPKSIGKFSNLKALLLENMVKSIPSEICECKNLEFLNLQNNPELTQIPECILDIPKFYYISLVNCKNVKLTDKQKSMLIEDEDTPGAYGVKGRTEF